MILAFVKREIPATSIDILNNQYPGILERADEQGNSPLHDE
jgi:hypothetical protein